MLIKPDELDKAVALLHQNDVVAIPTETVYGLAGNIFSEKAISKIFEVKQRPQTNPLIVHLHSMEQVHEIVADLPKKAQELAKAFWPGPLTLVLKKSSMVPDMVTAGKDSVAIRIPNHPLTLALLRQLSFPVAAPSANPFNRISPTNVSHVESYFKEKIGVLDGGDCTKGIESTIIGFEAGEPVIYRLGSIAVDDITAIVGPVELKNKAAHAPTAPGMLEKHYSPRTKTFLLNHFSEIIDSLEGKKIGLLRFTGDAHDSNFTHVEILSPSGSLEEASTNLYKALHKLDALHLDAIIAERLPDQGLGLSINDRLERAAK